MIDAETLKTVGEALYGPLWQSEMARNIGVNDRTVRRWASGARIPDRIRSELISLCDRRGDEIASARHALCARKTT